MADDWRSRAWTPERRAAEAERMRARNKDPEWNAKRNRSPGRRKASSEQMKRNNADPAFNAKKLAHQKDPARAEEFRKRGERLRDALESDIVVKATWRAGIFRANRKPERRKRSAEVLAANKAKPDAQARYREAISRIDHSAKAKKGWLTRRRNKIAARMKAKVTPENRREL